jgi:hypothetical protein
MCEILHVNRSYKSKDKENSEQAGTNLHATFTTSHIIDGVHSLIMTKIIPIVNTMLDM